MDTPDHTTIPLFPLTCRCSKCNQEYPLTQQYFRWRKYRNKYAWVSTCRNCERGYGKQYEQTERGRQRRADYRLSPKGQLAYRAAKHRPEYLRKQHVYRHSHRFKFLRIARDERKRKKPGFRLKHRIYEERRRARKQNTPDTLTSDDWQHCLDYFGGCCAVCGRPPGLFHIIAQDHWIPLSKGGGYTSGNIIPLCHSRKGDVDGCNTSKQDCDAAEWLIERYGKRKAAKILAKIEAYFKSLANEGE